MQMLSTWSYVIVYSALAMKEMNTDSNVRNNSFWNDRILDLSKLKALAGDKRSVAQIIALVPEQGGKYCCKRRNGYYHLFLYSPQCF